MGSTIWSILTSFLLLRSQCLGWKIAVHERGTMATIAIDENLPQAHSDEVRGRSFRPNSWSWLLCAAALLLFADGRNTIALAAWLAPALLLRCVRTQPVWRGLAVAYFAMILRAAWRCTA
jgi:hypothetical protein